jgi:endonuclease III related protein
MQKSCIFHKGQELSVFDIFEALCAKNLAVTARDEYWWPRSGSFEVVIGAILTQQTKWENVEKSLVNLYKSDLISLEEISKASESFICDAIRPSGFYNMKATRLKGLCAAIMDEYGSFESFVDGANREWLLAQKGVGRESADSILCYACKRDVMVVDSYTYRLLKVEMELEDMEYDEVQELIESSVEANYDRACELLGLVDAPLGQIYALFHGMIVEYCKNAFKGAVAKERLG